MENDKNLVNDVVSKKMRTILIISKDMTQVRLSPNFTSDVKCILDRGSTEYHTTSIKKGWYYIEELKGWIYYEDVYVPHPEEIIPDEEIIYVNNNITGETNTKNNAVTEVADDTIELINSSNKYIFSDRIMVKDGNKLYELTSCLSKLLSDVDSLNDLKIPQMPEDLENGILMCKKNDEDKMILYWKDSKFIESNIVINNEF